MNTRLTLQSASATLNRYGGDDLVGRLNQVIERITNTGLWKGILNQSRYTGYRDLGYITLAAGDESIVGVDFCCRAVNVYSQFYSFSQNGIGWIPEDKRGCFGGLVDMGDGYCTQRDIVGNATLRMKIESADDIGKTVRFYGQDEAGRDIFSTSGIQGINLTTASPSSDTAQVFTNITGIQFPLMVGFSTLWQVVDGVETQIGTYSPSERIPCYRRYKTGLLNEDMDIHLFCRGRFVPIAAPTDFIKPGCLAALKFGLQALTLEDAGTPDVALGYWAMATKELDNELSALRGSAITTLRISGNETMAGMGYGGYWGNWGVN